MSTNSLRYVLLFALIAVSGCSGEPPTIPAPVQQPAPVAATTQPPEAEPVAIPAPATEPRRERWRAVIEFADWGGPAPIWNDHPIIDIDTATWRVWAQHIEFPRVTPHDRNADDGLDASTFARDLTLSLDIERRTWRLTGRAVAHGHLLLIPLR